jgi:hypothetical protein
MKKITTEVSAKKEQYGDIVVTVHDKYGNLKQRINQPVDSFNNQLWRLMQNTLAGNNNTVLNTVPTGATTSFNDIQVSWLTADGNQNSYRGIVVGSGTTPTAINTTRLETIIEHGYESGKIVAMEVTSEYNVSQGLITITRSFVSLNSLSSTFSINEVGLAVSKPNTGGTFMIVRDILPSTISISFEEILTVQYRLRVSQGTNNFTNYFLSSIGLNVSGIESNVVNVTNTVFNLGAQYSRLNAPEANSTYGLTFGTSNTAFAKTQNNLLSPIAHGNNSGQLFYHPTTNGLFEENVSTNSIRFVFYRTVENRSGSSIDISEVGLVCAAGTQRYMINRKPVDPPVTITNGNSVSFSWEFCYTV